MDQTAGKSDEYEVKLEIFEGPLDLLLHLIRKNEVDIFDIPIAVITDQYLQYLDLMKSLNVSLAGDFLVMASTLVHIKSRMLLPQSGEDEDSEDPREEITRPLLEYMRLKELATELSDRPLLGRDVFPRLAPGDISEQFDGEEPLLRVNLFQLMDAFRKVLEQRIPDAQLRFKIEQWSVKDKMDFILESVREGKARTFADLFASDRTIPEFIATFLAVLELVQMGLLRVFQVGPLEEIRIELHLSEDQEDG
ncbi:MAG: chromosome segregation protein ScpA [Desulfobacteraceae bacterium]|nr:MAG: chromosome segregation protein ScpA [Desulfobacteraceae bacterium]